MKNKNYEKAIKNLPDKVIKDLENEMLIEFDRICSDTINFDEMENIILKIRNDFGKRLLRLAIEYHKSKVDKKPKSCPNCNKPMESKGRKKKH